MLPDNLTPQEQAQLHKMLADAGVDVSPDALRQDLADLAGLAKSDMGDWVQGKGFVRQESESEAIPVKTSGYNEPPTNIDLFSNLLDHGRGVYEGHEFQLSDARLKSVRKICVAQIADDLQSEIKRINGQMP